MVGALEVSEYDEWEEIDSDILRQLLLLPSFGRLQVLDNSLDWAPDNLIEGYLETLLAYTIKTEGAPCLRHLNLAYFSNSSPLRPRLQPLFDNGLANLRSLHMGQARENTVEQLGGIYRAGGSG